jgi:hypothetical protein
MLYKVGDKVRIKTLEEYEKMGERGNIFHNDPTIAKYLGSKAIITDDLSYMYNRSIYRIKFLEFRKTLIVSKKWLVPESKNKNEFFREAFCKNLSSESEIKEGIEDAEI